MHKLASQLYVGLATVDVATPHTCSAGCKCINMLIKSTVRSKAVWILTKIDSIQLSS